MITLGRILTPTPGTHSGEPGVGFTGQRCLWAQQGWQHQEEGISLLTGGVPLPGTACCSEPDPGPAATAITGLTQGAVECSPRQEEAPGGAAFIFLFKNIFLATHNGWHAGSFFPDQGWNPCPLQWKAQSPNHWTAREVPVPPLFLTVAHGCHGPSPPLHVCVTQSKVGAGVPSRHPIPPSLALAWIPAVLDLISCGLLPRKPAVWLCGSWQVG